jgi:hypothetical protein
MTTIIEKQNLTLIKIFFYHFFLQIRKTKNIFVDNNRIYKKLQINFIKGYSEVFCIYRYNNNYENSLKLNVNIFLKIEFGSLGY